ncbi:MAG TPA: GNAT family N-acetyltransferase [Azospirillaceae bacterium]|nr:GNAT family N-acetyltransferase [Azospirillaceae bacterium]
MPETFHDALNARGDASAPALDAASSKGTVGDGWPCSSPQDAGQRPATAVRTVEIVRDMAQLSMAMAIRSAVFMGEQDCPFDEEFDGNDLAGLHILGRVNGEPAATARVRFFADFFKLERVAVLPRFRGNSIDRDVVREAFRIACRKGYRRVFGTVRSDLVPYWQRRFGFRLLNRPPIRFSGFTFIPMGREFEADPDAICFETDAEVLGRPEGEWDGPGVLERSATRPALPMQRRSA